MKKNYTCPVCGYDKIENPIYDSRGNGTDEICSCCGFHFGCDDWPDKEKSYNEWRKKWIKNGCKWWAYKEAPPEDWDPKKQLENLKQVENKNKTC